MNNQFRCVSRKRALQVKKKNLNGIDYVEVFPPQIPVDRPLLLVFCFNSILAEGNKSTVEARNIRIEGGTRIKNIGIDWAQPYPLLSASMKQKLAAEIEGYKSENVLVVRPTRNGDFSTYTLRLMDSQTPTIPISGFDPVFSSEPFNFRVDCPSDFDCAPQQTCPSQAAEEPVIDYMAKDYASFRQLMFDRLSLLMPEWKERNPADIGVAFIELLAYIGDQLSYFQDAAATEAYLGTARKRISIRRHARLLDYFVHEGCNSRVWVAFKVNQDSEGTLVPKGTRLLAGGLNAPTIMREEDFDKASAELAVFETMHDLILYSARNEMQFYTWAEPDCCLPKGSTHATIFKEDGLLDFRICSYEKLKNEDPQEVGVLEKFLQKQFNLKWVNNSGFKKVGDALKISDGVNALTITPTADLNKAMMAVNGEEVDQFIIKEGGKSLFARCVRKGDVLIFHEARSPQTGVVEDADPVHRHAVRLTKVSSSFDSLTSTDVLEVYWGAEDALPFPLCLHKKIDPHSQHLEPTSTIYGNVVLADHGCTKNVHYLGDFGYEDKHGYKQFSEALEWPPANGLLRPRLSQKNLTYSASFDSKSSASSAFNYDAREALPNIKIFGEGELWLPQRDLLSSYPFALDFVVEVDNDGTASVRFGDNELGRKPLPSAAQTRNSFFALYRVGNGRQGNVGRESITCIANSPSFNAEGIFWARNPMEAQGGIDAEDMENVRQYAPQAFRTQERAVTEKDYAEVLQRHPGIQKACADFRWTGSWYTAFIAVDRFGGLLVDDAFKQDVVRHLERYRLSGYDLEITNPAYVPLDISLRVCTAPNYLWSNIERALLNTFNNKVLPTGEKGFFHPDNFTFGQTVYLSGIVEAALGVKGVTSIKVEVFQRYGKLPHEELQNAKIEVAPSEIARLDNDLNFPENGRIKFTQEAPP
jgi:hypothetical protein